jgi:hypothetical protein
MFGKKKKWGFLFKVKLALWALCFLSLLPVVNWAYHLVRNPSQVLSPFHRALAKTPGNTWDSYRESFIDNSTEIMTPELLAAIAQSESAGNPTAQPYWRWDLSSNPFEIYSPASSSSGLFQLTQGTYLEAKKFCIHNGKVAMDGPWFNLRSCWFNWTYSRLSATDSIEMTSARLHHLVQNLTGSSQLSISKKQELAAVIHLCGLRKAQQVLKQGAKLLGYCGDHHVGSYLAKIRSLERKFSLLRGSQNSGRKVAAGI